MSESQNTSVTCDSAFNLISSTPVESLNIVIHHFQHQKTGAVHYHIASEHDEKVFLVAVRTMPHDSTGVAHILEHTALCGSEKYPVRDPFFMMTRRSLNTFMNAMTSSDWTAYPFASQNDKDFDNLLDVYLDAVFFARLHELEHLVPLRHVLQCLLAALLLILKLLVEVRLHACAQERAAGAAAQLCDL